jgi:D-alanine-D-alanine ligase
MMSNSPSPKKIRVAVLYGGRSSEHEISLLSAASVIRNLDRSRFEVVPIGIDHNGQWYRGGAAELDSSKSKGLQLPERAGNAVVLPPAVSAGSAQLISMGGAGAVAQAQSFDVVFPVMHGTNCEDGAIQGLLELSEVPYVGPGILASAVGMDKDFSKRLVQASGIQVVPSVTVKKTEWLSDREGCLRKVNAALRTPMFVKPASLGSSVGVHKVKSPTDLAAALDDAFQYDLKVLVERGVNAREIEFAVLESKQSGEPPLVSVPGEIIPQHEFYSYEAKYLDENGAALELPAKLSPELTRKGQEIARTVFQALECEGMSRVDLFLDKDSGELYFNEINTIPGFTSISMYPKMMEASGVPYSELLTHLIELAIQRGDRKKRLKREWSAPKK